jgi:Zn-dependent peptidase ImmA (M78 family)
MDIKEKVSKLCKMYGTNDPFKLANDLDITILFENLGAALGYFDAHFRMRTIHISENAPEGLKTYICAHELGHAILHNKINTPYLSAYTLFSVAKIEKQANKFAVELLLPDDILEEYATCTLYNVAQVVGIPSGMEKLKTL